jgi:hypothetical protein
MSPLNSFSRRWPSTPRREGPTALINLRFLAHVALSTDEVVNARK